MGVFNYKRFQAQCSQVGTLAKDVYMVPAVPFRPITNPKNFIIIMEAVIFFLVFRVDLEEKKEELRQMVGRRYRDVLDASSSVRKVTESADAFANKLREIRGAVSDRSFTSLSWLARQQYIQLSALNKLYFLVSSVL